jgi:hypothetical protein
LLHIPQRKIESRHNASIHDAAPLQERAGDIPEALRPHSCSRSRFLAAGLQGEPHVALLVVREGVVAPVADSVQSNGPGGGLPAGDNPLGRSAMTLEPNTFINWKESE